jgi:hypothetical protein
LVWANTAGLTNRQKSERPVAAVNDLIFMVILSGSEMNGMTSTAFEQGAVPTSGRYRTQGMQVF